MTPEEFRQWLTESGLTWEQAALALGVSRATIHVYRHKGGKHMLRLACLEAKKTPGLKKVNKKEA